MSEQLQNENAQLKIQLKNLNATLQANQQTLSEAIQVGVNIRANLILFQNMVQDLNKQINELNVKYVSLEQQFSQYKAENPPKSLEAVA